MKKIHWICYECGERYGRRGCGVATWHEDVCDICEKKRAVTEPRDFGGISDKHRDLIIKMFNTKKSKLKEQG